MKIFDANGLKNIDQNTIIDQNSSSIELMERAATSLVNWYAKHISPVRPAYILCGYGNNGGDGLALARLLTERKYLVRVYLLDSSKYSPDNLLQQEKLKASRIDIIPLRSDTLPNENFDDKTVIVDALFGYGLNRPLDQKVSGLIKKINDSKSMVIAIDIPSGMHPEKFTDNICIKASYTLTFQFHKLSFLFPQNGRYCGKVRLLNIGLSKEAIQKENARAIYFDMECATEIAKKRSRTSHKGNNGHALIIGGSQGKIGAALLCAKACLVNGSGLTSVLSTSIIENSIHSYCPELMLESFYDKSQSVKFSLSKKYNAIGMGCGLGTDESIAKAFASFLAEVDVPLVLDADALNIISAMPDLINNLPGQTIITPHPLEFERLFGKAGNEYERLALQREKSATNNLIIVLKGANTCITAPGGEVFFNASGNEALATAGSGDVLTGIITSCLAQGYSPVNSALLGTFIHGLCADMFQKNNQSQRMIATDIINTINEAWSEILKKKCLT